MVVACPNRPYTEHGLDVAHEAAEATREVSSHEHQVRPIELAIKREVGYGGLGG